MYRDVLTVIYWLFNLKVMKSNPLEFSVAKWLLEESHISGLCID